MTPAARLQAAIELLDAIVASAADNGPAADTIIADWFRKRRYAGSGDRRAVRELVYRAIRGFGDPPESGRAAMAGLADGDPDLAAAFDGSGYGPAALTPEEPRAIPKAMPDWLGGLIDGAEHAALLERAPLDLRANRLKTTRDAMLAAFPGASAFGTNCVRLDPPITIENRPEHRDGLIEVQDAGSQLAVAACRATAGMVVVDLCAGGGGKTLALAADMAGKGRLIACDTDRTRLSKLSPRAARAGAVVEDRLLDGERETAMLADLDGAADVVLVDAPCSGCGTLRRNPEARWRLSPERLDRVLAVQRHVLALAAPVVRPGGALVYAVCSLIDAEGAGQAANFLAAHPDWTAEPPFAEGCARGPGRILSPSHDATDGFFVARLVRPC
ncbi:MAG: RsmB/NOP family class I SAM-dependent RNA methyltransferase [Sphingomonadaceae bacterium]|nr:RsmB/NOP family class I SAM-dependent RNA methyltransferase [Sphingomonadaceae bacterium]